MLLLSICVVVLALVLVVPSLFDRIDGRVGSYVMVLVALVAASVAAWRWQRRGR